MIESLTKSDLELEYETSTISGMSRKFGVSRLRIRNLLKSNGIPIKTHREAARLANTQEGKPIRKGKELAHQLLSDRDWLWRQRIELRSSKEDIARLANCSITLVRKYLKKHEIPDVKYNESEVSVRNVLQSRDTLSDMYENSTMEEIAKKIGSSKATVSAAFKKLGLKSKDPNSWDRKFNRLSAGHSEVLAFIRSAYNDDVEINNRTTIKSELDIFIPGRKLAIEYNGLFYHHERETEPRPSIRKDQNYHVTKTNLCESSGISLFHIFSDQWENQRPIIESMIRSKLGIVDEKKFARKLEIKTVMSKDRIRFFEDNHIQGRDQAILAYGLYEGDRLICCMSFGKPRFSSRYDWELIRFATCLNVVCVGGFSRLLAHFRKTNCGSIVSYSDRSYSDGNVYLKNGFQHAGRNPPGYWYTDNSYQTRYPRTMFTKKQLQRKFGISADLSERDAMNILGFKRVWNCGTDVWILDK